MGEIAVPDVAAERTYRVRYPSDEHATWHQCAVYCIKGLKDLVLGQMFQQVGRGDRGELPRTPTQNTAVITLFYLDGS